MFLQNGEKQTKYITEIAKSTSWLRKLEVYYCGEEIK